MPARMMARRRNRRRMLRRMVRLSRNQPNLNSTLRRRLCDSLAGPFRFWSKAIQVGARFFLTLLGYLVEHSTQRRFYANPLGIGSLRPASISFGYKAMRPLGWPRF